MIINGRYFWLPFNAISTLTMEPPIDLRDAVWTAATLTLINGGEIVALIPTRYPGSTSGDDGAAKLARSTTWADVGADTYVCTGQRLLTTDQGDIALMDIRCLEIDASMKGDEAAELPEPTKDG